MASNLSAMASNLVAMASSPVVMASKILSSCDQHSWDDPESHDLWTHEVNSGLVENMTPSWAAHYQ